MKISAVITCYNQEQWIEQAINSCIDQTVKIDIIVVDDGSQDNTSEVVRKYANIPLIEQENKGVSNARNVGIAKSSSDYVFVLDADDFISKNFVERCLEINDDIVGVGAEYIGHKEGFWLPPFKNPTFEDFLVENRIISCSLFKREIWSKIGGYDEQMKIGYEDWDFWTRATQAGYNVTTTQEVLFSYRKHEKSRNTVAYENRQIIREYLSTKFKKQ